MLKLPLESDRLRLRFHAVADRGPFIELVTDPRFYESLTVPPAQRTEAGAGEVFDTLLSSYGTEEPVFGLTIALVSDDTFVGTVALHPLPFSDALELFYAVVPERAGDGIATEAVKMVLGALPERDIVALAPLENEASKRVALAAGMLDEGVRQRVGGPARHWFSRPAAQRL